MQAPENFSRNQNQLHHHAAFSTYIKDQQAFQHNSSQQTQIEENKIEHQTFNHAYLAQNSTKSHDSKLRFIRTTRSTTV